MGIWDTDTVFMYGYPYIVIYRVSVSGLGITGYLPGITEPSNTEYIPSEIWTKEGIWELSGASMV